MGFFSSILGGSKSKSSSQTGYGALPKIAQEAMDEVTRRGQSLLLGDTGANIFRPLPQTAAETQAFGLMQGPTTQQGVSNLVAMFQNPYMNSVIDEINRQAGGEFSLYKQALSGAGQMGSNREFVNAAAADEARLRAIEQAKRESYNTALNTGLASNQQNIGNLLAQGEFTRGINAQENQAPLAALQAMAQLLGVYPATSVESSKSSSSPGIGGALQGIGAAMSLFSDKRLKENIKPVGNHNGVKIYEFSYKGDKKRYKGVMAQDVVGKYPDAVSIHSSGYMMVDYSKIGLLMEAV